MLFTGVALFTVPRFGGDRSLQYVYVAAAYAVHCFFFSLVVIAYSSLASAMTADAQERAKLGVWRNLSPVVVMIVVTALIAPLFTELAGRPAEIERFVVTVALLGSVIGFGLHLVCVRYSPERYRVAAAPPTVRETLRALSGNRPLVILCASQLILQTGLFTMVAAQAYYATYVLGDSAALVWIIAATSVATVVTLPILPRLAGRWGSANVRHLGGRHPGLDHRDAAHARGRRDQLLRARRRAEPGERGDVALPGRRHRLRRVALGQAQRRRHGVGLLLLPSRGAGPVAAGRRRAPDSASCDPLAGQAFAVQLWAVRWYCYPRRPSAVVRDLGLTAVLDGSVRLSL
jgi:hypothetical protein